MPDPDPIRTEIRYTKDEILVTEQVEAGGRLLMSGIPEPEGWHSDP